MEKYWINSFFLWGFHTWYKIPEKYALGLKTGAMLILSEFWIIFCSMNFDLFIIKIYNAAQVYKIIGNVVLKHYIA